MKCPTCEVDLVMAERQGIEIDYCPKCRGIWLDRGELDKIIERAAQSLPQATMPSPPPPQPRRDAYPEERYEDPRRQPYPPRDHHEHGGYGHRRRKRGSFLEDLFDFGD